MNEVITTISGVLSSIIATITIVCWLFYTKTQIDDKIARLKEHFEVQINDVLAKINSTTLQLQKEKTDIKTEIYDKLNENKQALEKGMQEFIKILTDIKETDRDTSVQFMSMIGTVKEELKNDYISRYNELLLVINTKANESDFNRLEQKFDKLGETMVEVKTIVQMTLDEKD